METKSTKILWISDCHLGYRQYGLARREQDFEDAHRATIEIGLGKIKADAFLDTGDILNSNRPNPSTMKYLAELNKRLEEVHVPYFLVIGNHDITNEDGIHWIDTIGGNSSSAGGIKILADNPQVFNGISMLGVGHMSKEAFLGLHIPKKLHILAIHAPVTDFIGFASSNDLSLADIPTQNAQIVCLGDIHVHDIREVSGVPVGYTGSLSLCSESEAPEKFGQLLEFQGGILKRRTPLPIIGKSIRPVIKKRVNNQEELEEWVAEVQQIYASSVKKPLVFLSFPHTLNAISTVRSVLNPDEYILRFKAFYVEEEDSSAVKLTREQNVGPWEFLKRTTQIPGDLEPVLAQLVSPDGDANEALDVFIEAQQ